MVQSVINNINNLLHQEPFSIVFDGVFWFVILLVGFPLAGFGCLLRMVYQVLYFFLGPRDINPTALVNNSVKQDLAVVITGCDSGFGRALALELADQGFVVFCGCLREESFGQFQSSNNKLIPLVMDVTSDDSVDAALQRITKWLAKSSGKKQRRLHSLVNNAGICYCGRIDWMKVADFKRIMDVNFFGTVRTTKAFMPIFKKQSAQGTYTDARIVNMISVAGMVAGGEFACAYEASKHATDAFTANLRLELRSFRVQVVALNPTFHTTPMANTKNIETGIQSVWGNMSPALQEEYGEEYLEEVMKVVQLARNLFWPMQNVVAAMKESVIAKYPQIRYVVGMDGRYSFIPAGMIRSGVGIQAFRATPAMMRISSE